MEQRLIDANAIKLEQGFFEKVDNVPKFYEWLNKQPTVDAVPVDSLRELYDWLCARAKLQCEIEKQWDEALRFIKAYKFDYRVDGE